MKLIAPTYKILEQNSGLQGIYEQIEIAGRTCYKSTRKEGTTAKDFVDRLTKSGHLAMLEHGTVYLKVTYKDVDYETVKEKYLYNKYSKCVVDKDDKVAFITTNMRVIQEMFWHGDLVHLCEPTENHIKRVTVIFTTSNGIAREFTRHRLFSFAQESTRYCNYASNKFGGQIFFIQPIWFTHNFVGKEFDNELSIISHSPIDDYNPEERTYLRSLLSSERSYFSLINSGLKPQEARGVLPLSLKTELVMTGFVPDWIDFFKLRALGTTGAPHPEAKLLAEPLMNEFKEKGYGN